VEAAIEKGMGKRFLAIVRPVEELRRMLESDPYRGRAKPDAKRIVTFVRRPHPARLKLPIEKRGARILAMRGGEIFSAYVPSPRGPVFMTLIDNTFGKTVTTRRKCATA